MNSDVIFGFVMGVLGVVLLLVVAGTIVGANKRIDFKRDCTINGGIVLEMDGEKQVCLPPQVLEMKR